MKPFLVACLAGALARHAAGVFFVANRGSTDFAFGKLVIEAKSFKELPNRPKKSKFGVTHNGARTKIRLAEGTAGKHTGLVVDDETVATVDTNDLQVALAEAAEGCAWDDFACVASGLYGSVPEDFARRTFTDVWLTWKYWSLCNEVPPAPALRTMATRTGHSLEVLREAPMVATVRGFVSEAECGDLIRKAQVQTLTRAHVGSGGGGTTTSESRETLTNSLWVNWDVEDTLSLVAARTFDLASDLLGVNVPYEGQEPINFLHYLKGYEYRPHHDGAGSAGGNTPPPKGKRIGTTLVYCEAPDVGGATVFTRGARLRFQPGRGDILFFAYNPDPRSEAEHAACPVVAGNKTTLTQWHRLGVSNTMNWDNFENWGKFHNPHLSSVWKGPRLSVEDKSEL